MREIEYKGKTYAGKLVKKMNMKNNIYKKEDIEKEIIIGLKGPKIVKVYKIYEEEYNGQDYILYIMEIKIFYKIYKIFIWEFVFKQ